MNKLSEIIYELRKARGLSQEELSDKLEVSRQTVSKWESGKVVPDAINLLALSKFFEVDINTLVNGSIADVETAASSALSQENTKEKPNTNNKKRTIILKTLLAFSIIGVIFTLLFLAIAVVGLCIRLQKDSLESVTNSFFDLTIIDVFVVSLSCLAFLIAIIVVLIYFLRKNKK